MLRFPAITRQHDNRNLKRFDSVRDAIPFRVSALCQCHVNCNKIWLQYPTVQCDLIINRRRLIRTSCEPMRNFTPFNLNESYWKVEFRTFWCGERRFILCSALYGRARSCFGARGAEIHCGVTLRRLLCVSRDRQTDTYLTPTMLISKPWMIF